MWKTRLAAFLVLAAVFFVAFFVLYSEPKAARALPKAPAPAWFAKFPFRLGLDLSGGTHLVYRADVSNLDSESLDESLGALRDVIERRVNLFGVTEPVVQLETGGAVATDKYRLIVDLPGITNIDQAISLIGRTPTLEFRIQNPDAPEVDENTDPSTININEQFLPTELTGRYLKNSRVEFDPQTGSPYIALVFTKEGADLFQKITKENIGKPLAIFLDGAFMQAPTVQSEIAGGEAIITGTFTIKEAKEIVGYLNSGALPVPIELVTTQTIGATLGEEAISAGLYAALIGFLAVAIFLILWYRLPGLIAGISLLIYVALTLLLYKLIPVTLTTAGIAGFIISLGMAVDANVLVFERLKEEMRLGKSVHDAMEAAFSRAWFSIRDANTSALITAVILFWFGTSLIKGFALTLGLGVLLSLLSAITISRVFLRSIEPKESGKLAKFLFSSGVTR